MLHASRHTFLACSLCLLVSVAATGQSPSPAAKARARELGLSALIGGNAGPLDAITDVAGVEVGHTTLISGEGRLVVGQGPVRTGVTVVHPRGKASSDPVFGAWFTLNGNGEMTGTTWLQESGFLEGPVAITNTHSVGVVRDAIMHWQVAAPGLQPWGLPVVAETYDGGLNDINGFHVKAEHPSPRSTAPPREPCPKATWAAAPAWCATASRAASAPRRACSRSGRRLHASACWCSATTARGATCGSPACRSARRSPTSRLACRSTDRLVRPGMPRCGDAARRPARRRRLRARSSSSSPRMRRCCRTS